MTYLVLRAEKIFILYAEPNEALHAAYSAQSSSNSFSSPNGGHSENWMMSSTTAGWTFSDWMVSSTKLRRWAGGLPLRGYAMLTQKSTAKLP